MGDYVTIAAQCGIAGHLTIGDKAILAARTGVMSDLEGGQPYWGAPASPFAEARKQFVAIRKLPEAFKELRQLKKQADEIRKMIEEAIGATGEA